MVLDKGVVVVLVIYCFDGVFKDVLLLIVDDVLIVFEYLGCVVCVCIKVCVIVVIGLVGKILIKEMLWMVLLW